MSAPRTLVVLLPDLRVGGLQAMAVRLALALDRAEWRPLFVTFDGGGPLAAELQRAGVAHREESRRPGVDLALAGRLARLLATEGAALLHCHNATALFHGARAARAAGRLPVLYTEHDRDLPAPWKHRLLHRWLARRVRATVAVSAALARALVATEGFPAERTHELVNGVPDPRARCAESRAEARARLGWDAAPVVLTVGSLTEVKRQARLIEAGDLVRARVPAARVVIAGEGPLRAELQGLAAARPRGAVTLLGERDDVPRLLAACDVFALPSRSEGLPLALVEAHGAGRACAAFDVGGCGEVLADGESGRLVPAGDVAALGGALSELLLDAPLRARCEAEARRRYETLFTHERMVARYVAHYRALCGGGPA